MWNFKFSFTQVFEQSAVSMNIIIPGSINKCIPICPDFRVNLSSIKALIALHEKITGICHFADRVANLDPEFLFGRL
jgi:hypothetical protein